MVVNTLAIKLGSSYTSIFKQGEGIVLFEPTLVAYSGSGANLEIKAIGNNAKKMQGRVDSFSCVVSPICAGRVVDIQLASVLLSGFLSKILTKTIFGTKIKAVVCVPLGLSNKEKKDYERVLMNCGIHDFTLIPSVVCGAVGYELPVSKPEGVCVVNIGGGSTDIAIICNGTVIAGLNIEVGGKVIDEAVAKQVSKDYHLLIGEGVAESLKREVGSLYANDMSNGEVTGIDEESKLSRSVVIESQMVYSVIEPYYRKIAEAIVGVIYSAPPNIVEDIMNNGIFVMGGASLVTGLEQYFRKIINTTISILDETTAIDVIGAGKVLSDAKLLKTISEL